jgi:hypothetical protein
MLRYQWAHLCVDIGDFFDCTTFPRPAVFRSNHASIRTLTEFLDVLVLCIDYKVGIQCCKAMPLHVHNEGRRLVEEKMTRTQRSTAVGFINWFTMSEIALTIDHHGPKHAQTVIDYISSTAF